MNHLCSNCKNELCWYHIKVPTNRLPIEDVVTAEKYEKINLICKKELGKIFKEQLGKKEFGCKSKMFHHAGGCTCHCNDWNLGKEELKKAGYVSGAVVTVGAGVGVTVVTLGIGAPFAAALCMTGTGLLLTAAVAVGIQYEQKAKWKVDRLVAHFKDGRLNPLDFGLNIFKEEFKEAERMVWTNIELSETELSEL